MMIIKTNKKENKKQVKKYLFNQFISFYYFIF
jgi:hypothetical protein